jgi:hypothetical protein
MKYFGSWLLRGCLAAFLLATSVPTDATAQDLIKYEPAAKGQLFDQFTSGAPTLSATGFMFQASVTGASSNTILSAAVQVPGGSNIVLSLTDPANSRFKFEALFIDQPSLDAVFTNGTYQMTIVTTNDGTLTPSLDISGDAYPNPPQILNFDAAQVIDTMTNFVFTWGSFTNGTTNDVVSFEIDDVSGNPITNTPDFGQPGQLDGTATNFLVPAGLLTMGTTNTGHLEFIKVISSDTNSVPGALGVTGYFAETQFSIMVNTTVCAFAISPTNVIFTAAGGDGGVIITATDGCAWTATNNDSFITINSGTSGTGNGLISFTVAANTNGNEITGTMTIAGQTFTVVQTGVDCTFLLDSTSASYGATGGASNIVVTAGTNCDWMAASNNSFITITAGNTGLGNGTVSYTVAANISSNELTGTITVAGQTYTITEAGVTCAFLLDSTNADFDVGGGSSNILVTANGTNCAWTAVSNSGFITITAGSSGAGNGTVSYTVATNTDTIVQTGSMTIAGQTYTVTEPASACAFTLNFTNANLTADGASGDIPFTANGTNCAWTAVSNDSFITITNGPSGTSGVGNGTVTVAVATNTETVARTGTLTIAGQTFTITEDAAACAFSLDPTSANFSAAGGSSNVVVIANGTNCDWIAASNSGFIAITDGTNGLGSGTVSYTVAANTGTARTVTMTIADQTFTAHQAGATLDFALTNVVQTCKTMIVKRTTTTNTTCAVNFDLTVNNTGVANTSSFYVLIWLRQGSDFNPNVGVVFLAKRVRALKEGKSATFRIRKSRINGDQAGTFLFVTDTANNVLASAEIPSP